MRTTHDSHKDPQPPGLATAFLEWYCSDDFFEEVQGDLGELYQGRLERFGERKSNWLYAWDVLRFFRFYLLKQKLFSQNIVGPIMFKNYMKIAFRNLLKHKGYSFINIAGLVTGLTACILILLYVQDELSYDKFHVNADRIYRVTSGELREGRFWHLANNYAPAAPALLNDFPDIEAAVRIFPYSVVVERDANSRFQEDKFAFVDSTFFEMFSFSLKQGDAKTVLRSPDGVLITETVAKKYFGNQDAMGRILTVENQYDFKVVGVLWDLPSNSHFHFDFLAPIASVGAVTGINLANWHWPPVYTYILLPPQYPVETLHAQFPAFIGKNLGSWAPPKRRIALQPLTDIRLHSDLQAEMEPTSNVAYVYILATIAFFILVIACINFMNLATARSANRAKEVGLRKVVGAQKSQLIYQFFGESMFYAFLSLLLAIGLVEFLLPFFNQLIGKQLDVKYLENWTVLAGFANLTFVVGLLSGMYPAMFLSSFRPAKVLRASSSQGANSPGHSRLRSLLVVVQFAISIGLIINATVIKEQLDFIRNKKLGFGKDQIVVISVRDGALQNNLDAFKNSLLANSGILAATATSTVPGIERDLSFPINAEGLSDDFDINFHNMLVDHDFLRTFDMEVLQGRDFDKAFTADTSGSFILNEMAVAALGWSSPLHKRMEMHAVDSGQDKKGQVIGVVKDFHFRSLHHKIEPLVLLVSPRAYYLDNLAVRVHSKNVSQALAFIEQKWREVVPNRPFEYTFLDTVFEEMYRNEQRLGEIFNYFSALAIFVGCLGLFGLASYTAEQRTREIGIRKVLGASAPKIVLMLSKELVILVGVAFLVAAPIAYYAMDRWLQEFVYRVDLNPFTFVMSGVLALTIALLTISYQALRAAFANPVDALRYQ